MSSSFEFTYDLGCRAAQADAKHDFKGAFSPDDIRQSVASMTNIAGNLQCDVRPQNEDSFLSQSILAPGANLRRIKESIREEVAQQRYAALCRILTQYFLLQLLTSTQFTMRTDPEQVRKKEKEK